MTTDTPTLADAVLPLIRSPRRDLRRYAAATEQGGRMLQGVALLEQAVEDPEGLAERGVRPPAPQETYRTVHKALASAIRVIARADDSAGIIGDACRTLIDLHPRAAAAARVPQLELADWVFDFHFDDQVDYFELDPVDYAPALGEKGVARLRSRVDALREELPPVDPDDPFPVLDRRTFLVRWFDQRFAVLDRDIEAVIRTHLGAGRVAASYEDVARALEEIDEVDLAIEWARRATELNAGLQAQRASRRWWRLLSDHRPEDLPDAARVIFGRWPTSESGARWMRASGDHVADEVQRVLESRPDELVRFQLDVLKDPRTAWRTAHRTGVTSASVWADLARAYLPIDALAALRVQVEIVDASLVEADTRRYRPAARELVRIRESAVALGGDEGVALVDEHLADLRERYARRPSLLAALDRAGLP